MMVENLLTSEGDPSVREVQACPMGMRSKAAHRESGVNKAELRALQKQQDGLRNELIDIVEQQWEEIAAHKLVWCGMKK